MRSPARAHRALVCLFAFIGSALPLGAFGASPVTFDDAQSMRAMALLNGQPCAQNTASLVAQATPAASPVPSAASPGSPAPGATPTIPPAPLSPGKITTTPFPQGTQVTPPPVPTATPSPLQTNGPTFLVRPSSTPSIAPVGPGAPPSASPVPTGAPTLRPGYIAVLADKVTGSTKPGQPGDASGNVHIFYQDEVLVGQRAHYDGVRTIVVSGDPYIVNNAKNSILYADRVIFDTVAQKAELVNGRGESSQGVEKGLVYFAAKDLKSDEHGVAHGDYATVTTCEHPRSGYHLTGRTIDVIPSDRIVISKAVLFLGAIAVFYLPKVVIPLRTVTDERQRPHFFPEVGYNSYQGFYVKARLPFGRDQYYYGYYRIEFYTKQGIGLGYDSIITKKNGKRQTVVDFYGINNRQQGTASYNLSLQDTENISRTLRGQLGFTYNSNFGPIFNLPPNTSVNAQLVHSTTRESQTYTFAHSAIGSQSSTNNFGFTDTRNLGTNLDNNLTFNLNRSDSNYGGFFSDNASADIDDILHWSNPAVDYQLEYDKTFAQQPYGINKEPELQIRPYQVFQHFIFPVASTLTVGLYNEPQTPETTTRGDLNVSLGPALMKIFGSDFSANVTFDQYAYGTGDLKAAINQNATLTTPIGRHIVNNITYTETNYNGPAFVPFDTLDQQPTQNFKNAADVLRFYNSDYYDLSLNFNTAFDGVAQPVSYQLAMRPSTRSYLMLAGSFIPGGGQGFYTTNVQYSAPFGKNAFLQFIGDIDWKNGARIENKNIYYSKIIGDCYQVQVQYNEAASVVNVTVSLLAFPSHAASFGLNTAGSIIPSSFNGYSGY